MGKEPKGVFGRGQVAETGLAAVQVDKGPPRRPRQRHPRPRHVLIGPGYGDVAAVLHNDLQAFFKRQGMADERGRQQRWNRMRDRSFMLDLLEEYQM